MPLGLSSLMTTGGKGKMRIRTKRKQEKKKSKFYQFINSMPFVRV